jgi:putative endonuclease
MAAPSASARPPRSGRSHNLQLGRHGEDLAAAEYAARGYTVVARNWRDGRLGELDLVVVRAGGLVVCEVKTRSSTAFGLPAEAVDFRKQRRIRALTVRFIAASAVRPASIRFDVAAVIGDTVELLEAAF